MKTKQEIKEWLLDNCVNWDGVLDLTDLDFSDFEGIVNLSRMKVKEGLSFTKCEIGGDLYIGQQKVGGHLYQESQNVVLDIFQDNQSARRIFQTNQKTTMTLIQDKMIDGKTYIQALKDLKEKYGIKEE